MTLMIETKPVPLVVREDGAVWVAGSRIPLDTIVYAFRKGNSAEEIGQQFDAVKLADVYAILSYYLDNQEKVDAYIRRREAERAAIHREIDAQFDQKGFWERLEARRKEHA